MPALFRLHPRERLTAMPFMMATTEHHTSNAEHQITARCPSCGHKTIFTYGGVQHWPPRVAQAMGVPESVTLWLCGHCQSTISETELKF